jgi:hypothetical protein
MCLVQRSKPHPVIDLVDTVRSVGDPRMDGLIASRAVLVAASDHE